MTDIEPLLFLIVPLFTVVFPFAVVITVSIFTPPAVLLMDVFPFVLTTSPVICIPCEPLFVIFSSPSVFSTVPRLVIAELSVFVFTPTLIPLWAFVLEITVFPLFLLNKCPNISIRPLPLFSSNRLSSEVLESFVIFAFSAIFTPPAVFVTVNLPASPEFETTAVVSNTIPPSPLFVTEVFPPVLVVVPDTSS